MKIFNKVSTIAVLVVSFSLVFTGQIATFAATTVNLGTADGFAVLAGSGITDTTPSTIAGDVGLSPTTGAAIGLTAGEVTGTIYAVDIFGPAGSVSNPGLLTIAKNDLDTAYTAAGQVTTVLISADLGGQTLSPGVYQDNGAPNSLAITGTLTLDGGGDPNAVFIFKSGSTLVTGANSHVNLINGAQACNVFWQVASSATLGTNSDFKGNILAFSSITDNGGSTVYGRLLARNAAVTLNNTTLTKAVCLAPSTITVVKVITNDNGRTKAFSDFPLFVNGVSVVRGVPTAFVPGAYAVTETTDPDYTQTFSGDCDSTGHLSIISGDAKTCIITNDDIASPAIMPIYVAPVPPLIEVVKVPSPLALPSGPGLVAYTYTLRNIGTVPASDITMVGDTCSPIIRVSGDADSNGNLDVNEAWVYSCSTTLTKTHTNTVVATAWANGISATDISSATVVVGTPAVPPLIHITKIPSPLSLPADGGMVTYTKKVTNPGTAALSNVQVTDDKCSPVEYISGDVNSDSKLDNTETWTYACQEKIIKTTTNTAVATGEANGLTARDFAIATVVVAATNTKAVVPATIAPKLPTTGIAPDEGGMSWDASIFSIVFLTLFFIYIIRKQIEIEK